MGCSWNTNETSDPDEKPTTTSVSTKRIPARKITYPSFSLSNNYHEEAEEKSDDRSESSSQEREAAQSQASKLMSRRRVHSEPKGGDDDRQAQPPQRIMLENILDSFDRLVDARIRAYERILSNHVRVLSESNNTMGARIAEYKLQTMLEFAANHLLLDSISMEFKTIATQDDGCNDDDENASSSTSAAAEQDSNVSLPIELTVEIRSPRFCHECVECVEAINSTVDASPPHPTHQGKLTFRAHGEVRGRRNVIGRNAVEGNDTDRCPTTKTEVCRNSKDGNRDLGDFLYESIEIDVDCNALLSQMMEEASKVVTLAVELTNLAWTNNTQKQEELMNDIIAENTENTANVIVDDDESLTAGERSPQRLTRKRSRYEDQPDAHAHTGSTMAKKVSEVSLLAPQAQAVCDAEHIEEPDASNDSPSTSSSSSATITNIHVLEQDTERKTRYFVSDPSYASFLESDHEATEVCPDEQSPPEDQDNTDEYNSISAERACHIVDFVLAGDIIPYTFSPNKKQRTT